MPKSHKSTAGWRARREQRQEEAQGRQMVWEGLSHEKQLENLESRPGASTRQREKIQRRMEVAKAEVEQKAQKKGKKGKKSKPPRQGNQKKDKK